MTLKFKMLGVAALAVFAFSAVAASASAHVFVSPNNTTVVTAEQEEGVTNFLGIKGAVAETKCKKGSFSGTVTGKEVGEITVHPTYSECTTEPLGASPVTTTGCNFTLTGTTESHAKTESGTETDATVSEECEAGKAIQIAAPGCTVSIGAQTNLLGVTYTNLPEPAPSRVTVKVTVDGISYTSPGGFFCALGGIATAGNNAFLTGAVIAKGFEDKCAAGACPFAPGGTGDKDAYTEGAQTAISFK